MLFPYNAVGDMILLLVKRIIENNRHKLWQYKNRIIGKKYSILSQGLVAKSREKEVELCICGWRWYVATLLVSAAALSDINCDIFSSLKICLIDIHNKVERQLTEHIWVRWCLESDNRMCEHLFSTLRIKDTYKFKWFVHCIESVLY